jgi:sec-independent protein translocase protein TatB
MEVLGIGPLEALFVLILALLVVGPRELGRAARSFGRFLNRLYRSEGWAAITQASRNLRTLPNRLAREAALEELDEARSELRQAGQGVGRALDQLGRELKGTTAPTESEPQPRLDPPNSAPPS